MIGTLVVAAFALSLLAAAFLLVSLAPSRFRLALWCVVIVLGVAPWWSAQGHAHWDRVQWLPFVPPPVFSARDVVVNVALYLPFGLFAGGARPGARHAGLVVAAAVVLSAATELTQVYSHGRFPAVTDVGLNAAGAWLGLALARRRARARYHSGDA